MFIDIVAICQYSIYVKSKKINLENTERRITSNEMKKEIEIMRKK